MCCKQTFQTICLNVYHKLLLPKFWQLHCHWIFILLQFTQTIGISTSSVLLHFHIKDIGFVITPKKFKQTPWIWLNRFHNWTKRSCFHKCFVNFQLDASDFHYNKFNHFSVCEMELGSGTSGGIIPRSLGEYVKQPFITNIFVAGCDIYRRVHARRKWKSIAAM